MALSPQPHPDASGLAAPLDWTSLRDFLSVAETGSPPGLPAARVTSQRSPGSWRRWRALKTSSSLRNRRRQLTESGYLSCLRRARWSIRPRRQLAISRARHCRSPDSCASGDRGLGVPAHPRPLAEFQLSTRRSISAPAPYPGPEPPPARGRHRGVGSPSAPIIVVGRKVGGLASGLRGRGSTSSVRGAAEPRTCAQSAACVDEATRWLTGPGAGLARVLAGQLPCLPPQQRAMRISPRSERCGIGARALPCSGKPSFEQVRPARDRARVWLITHPLSRRTAHPRRVDFLRTFRCRARAIRRAAEGAISRRAVAQPSGTE